MTSTHDSRVCPTCGDILAAEEVEGSSLPSLICPQKHRFYVEILCASSPLGEPPENMDLVSASQLIRDSRYSCHLSNQVATLLRRIEEIGRGQHVERKPFDTIFSRCPRCGGKLTPGPAWDSWCSGLRCQNGHRFDYRNGLHFIDGNESTGFTLLEEMPDEDALFLSRRYVEDQDNPWIQLPRAALQAMMDFLRTRETG